MRNRLACLGQSVNFDANETAFIEKQLEDIEVQAYDVLYSILKSTEFVPFDPSIPEWARTWVYRSWSKVGMAALITGYSDDLPRVDVGVEETPHNITRYGDAYGYNIDELEESARLNEPLENMRAVTAREVLDRQTDQFVAFGESKKNVFGFLNNPNVPPMTVTNGDWLNPATTADKILADMFEIEAKVIDQSGEHHMPTDMILPPAYYNMIVSRRVGDNGETTILQYFLKNAQSVKTVSRWAKLATAGAGNIPIIVCYRKDPQIVKFRLAYDFKQLEPEKRNLEWVVDCVNKLGGTVWYRPLGGVYANGMHE